MRIPLTSLRETRERKGITIEQLSAKTGVSATKIADLESGELDFVDAGVGELRLILLELSMSMDKLFQEYEEAAKQ